MSINTRRRAITYPKISNRERQRIANACIARYEDLRLTLIAVLAQKGGEVVVTQGTLDQVTADMDFEKVPNTEGTEVTVRITKGEGGDDAKVS